MISTIIINTQKQDRDKITALLSAQDDFKVLAYGEDGYDALKLICRLKPDIAILDNHLDFIEGEDIPPLVRNRSPSTAIIILTAKISDYQLYKAVSNEVSGFVLKETDMDILPMILKCVFEGGCFINPLLAARIRRFLPVIIRRDIEFCPSANYGPVNNHGEQEKFTSKEDPARCLSKMELRILTFIGEGYTSGEIAENLNLAVGTVRNYISAIMHKTGMHNRPQMVRYAFHYDLVPIRF